MNGIVKKYLYKITNNNTLESKYIVANTIHDAIDMALSTSLCIDKDNTKADVNKFTIIYKEEVLVLK